MEALFPSDYPRQKGHLLREQLQLRLFDSGEGNIQTLNENNYREKIQSCAYGDYVEIHIYYTEH